MILIATCKWSQEACRNLVACFSWSTIKQRDNNVDFLTILKLLRPYPIIQTSLPVGTCFASLTLAKLPLPIVFISLYLPMCGSSEPRLLEDIRGLALSSVPCSRKKVFTHIISKSGLSTMMTLYIWECRWAIAHSLWQDSIGRRKTFASENITQMW